MNLLCIKSTVNRTRRTPNSGSPLVRTVFLLEAKILSWKGSLQLAVGYGSGSRGQEAARSTVATRSTTILGRAVCDRRLDRADSSRCSGSRRCTTIHEEVIVSQIYGSVSAQSLRCSATGTQPVLAVRKAAIASGAVCGGYGFRCQPRACGALLWECNLYWLCVKL